MQLARTIGPDILVVFRRLVLSLRFAIVAVLFVATSSQALSLVGVQSRKTHGAQGEFNLRIDPVPSITAAVTVEPRVLGSGYNVAFQFDGPINSPGTVSVIDELFAPVFTFATTTANNEVIVRLSDIADNKRLTISLKDVNGITGLNASASIGFLIGDVSQSGLISASDISAVKGRVNMPLALENFWFDVNATGGIDDIDVSLVKSRSGRQLVKASTVNGIFVPPDPGPAANSAVEGVDVNANGVRDEVERALANSYGDAPTNFDAVVSVAREVQSWLRQPDLTEAEAQALVLEEIRLYRCLSIAVGADTARVMAKEVDLRTFNNASRRMRRRAILDKAGTFEIDLAASLSC